MPNPPAGVPVYGWESLLRMAGLANQKMLRQHRRQPAPDQKPAACYWSGHDYVLLYRDSDAVDMPPLSPGRQRRYDANRTCAECGKTSVDPWELGNDNKRYCPTCQGPVHQRMWKQERAADKPVIAEWARGVLADPSVILGASRNHQWYREMCVEDLAGAVLLDAKIRYSTGKCADPEWLTKEHFADAVFPDAAEIVDRVRELACRRPVTWWSSCDMSSLAVEFDDMGRPINGPVTTADADHFGRKYARWAGKLAGSSYRWHPRLADPPPPWDPREQVTRMRQVLAEMAALGGDPDVR